MRVETAESRLASMALDDIARLLRYAFESLGLPCTCGVNTLEPGSTNIVLGYHLLDGPGDLDGHDCVIYQLEQLPGQTGWLTLDDRRLALLSAVREVWDFSTENIDYLAERGLGAVKLLPFGFHQRLQTVAGKNPDIDVLFYGAVNARRKAVLNALAGRCRTKTVFGAYGARRDQYVARSKVVLNVHHHPAQIMEQPRVSYLLNNRRFVVSEDSRVNPFAGALVTAPYDELVECCLRYLNDPGGRDRMAETGYDFLARRPMSSYLRAVLGSHSGR